MKYGSVCSGIEAATVAWHSLRWKPVWFSEIEPFPCKVLKHHYPDVPNLGDMTKLNQHEIYNNETIELLVGGTPCQSFSIAGLRGGMDDERGNLALEYCRILIAKQPRWFVWENVPGVFSSITAEAEEPVWMDYEDGRAGDRGNNPDKEVWETQDFATLLKAFQECGYSCAWRVLDAQYFGVPQRRRRVFVVGHLGNDWRPPYAVLFERDSLRRDFEAGAKARKRTAGKVEGNIDCTEQGISGTVSSKWAKSSGGPSGDEHYNLIAQTIDCRNDKVNKEISGTLQSKANKGQSLNFINPVVQAFGAQNSHHQTMNVSEQSPTLDKSKVPAVCYGIDEEQNAAVEKMGCLKSHKTGGSQISVVIESFQQNADGELRTGDVSFTLNKNSNASGRNAPLLCQTIRMRGGCEGGGKDALISDESSLTLASNNDQTLITEVVACDQADTITIGANQTTGRAGDTCATGAIARRLTPLECERLQGFPCQWTNIPGAKDSPRYASIGNSMAVPVMHWIGSRIDKVDKILKSLKTP